VPFTAAKNTPFQGLAADGCKQAMWNLTKAGYRIVAFIHDEFIIELSIAIDIDHAAGEIAAICSDSMQPFVPGIPVPCEFALTDRWYKGAEAVYDESGRLQVWRPNSSNGGLSG
jgi:DNA polymerase I-like protein with 3'-5' exonuclease and polymerase domains